MVSSPGYDLVVVGAGPGGYVAAIRAAQLGLKAAVVEEEELGGICLNWGCIPSKALLRNADVVSLVRHAETFGITYDNLTVDYSKAIDRSRTIVSKLTQGVAHLLKKNKVDHIVGRARFIDSHTLQVTPSDDVVRSENVIIATGARPRVVDVLPIDGEHIITSRDALARRDLPSSAVIVGGGAVGVEFASIYNAYGVDVTIVEMLPRLLPNEDEEISQQLERALSKLGITVMTSTKVIEKIPSDKGVDLKIEGSDGTTELKCDQVLVAVGVQGNVENLGLENTEIKTQRGFVEINGQMATNVPGVYAIGDVTGKLLLAHAASAQGVFAVEYIAGLDPPSLNYKDMPKATYSMPQVASFGLTEREARDDGYDVSIGKFFFQANGKALALGDTQGMLKLVSDVKYGEILGAHLIGADVTELLAELSMTRMLEGTVSELGWMVHSHPTLSEAVKEAALSAKGQALHM